MGHLFKSGKLGFGATMVLTMRFKSVPCRTGIMRNKETSGRYTNSIQSVFPVLTFLCFYIQLILDVTITPLQEKLPETNWLQGVFSAVWSSLKSCKIKAVLCTADTKFCLITCCYGKHVFLIMLLFSIYPS